MKTLLTCIMMIGLVPLVNGQVKHKVKKSTNAGSLFIYWGYNRSYYTHSTIHFTGQDYDFKMRHVAASDRPDAFRANVYLNPSTLTVPQYTARIGYYISDKWAISAGVDHFKYVMNDQNKVLVDGYIKPGLDTNFTQGNYSNQQLTTNRNYFHYENTNGCNFIRVELMRSFDLLALGSNRQFAITGNLGASTGPVLTFNDLNFEQVHSFATPSISGFGLSLNGGIRMEFFRHIFVQMNTGLGYIDLVHVKNRPNDRHTYSKQMFGYYEYNVAVGCIFYLRKKNGCDSCPQ